MSRRHVRLMSALLGLVTAHFASFEPALADPGESVADAVIELIDIEGVELDLAATVAEHEATVLVWYATTCPCVSRYEERIEALRASWPDDRVAMLGVASNADDDLERVRAELEREPYPLPVVVDVGGRLARSLDVFSTPTVVLLDSAGDVLFQGWLDNEEDLDDDDREAYLDEALEAVLSGQSVDRNESPIYGCPVTRTL